MSSSVTREEFYNLVWTKPIAHLAEEFSLPADTLHKICKKHRIPKPPVGYWNKLAAGKPVVQIPLPPSDGEVSIAMSESELRDEPDVVFEAREKARLALMGIDVSADTVAHPVVMRTMKELLRGRPLQTGIVKVRGAGRINCEIAPPSFDRLELTLNRLAAAAGEVGIELVSANKGAVFRCDGEAIGFRVIESVRRAKHIPTEKERAAQEAWHARQEGRGQDSDRNGYPGSDPFPETPEWDYHLTGRLSFELERDYLPGVKTQQIFRDGSVQRLETMAVEIVVGISVQAAARKAEQARRDAIERDMEERRLAREQEARLAHIRQRRVLAIDDMVEEVEQIARLRRLLKSARNELGEVDAPRVRTFIEFATGQLAYREATFTVAGLVDRFERLRLFGDDDDFDFGTVRR